ncbi:flagellar hook-length control protein FliK, partial [Methylobacterium crusticola]
AASPDGAASGAAPRAGGRAQAATGDASGAEAARAAFALPDGSAAQDQALQGATVQISLPQGAAQAAQGLAPAAQDPASAAQAGPSAPAAGSGAAPPSVAAPLGAVPITIGMRALAGSNRFEIRLDPVDLGRIDVSLDIDRAHGAVRAHLVVERPETLALLQRDAGSLEQALGQAGFTASDSGLSFSLRDGGGQNTPGRDGSARPQGGDRAPAPPEAETAALVRVARPAGGRYGLDIRI